MPLAELNPNSSHVQLIMSLTNKDNGFFPALAAEYKRFGLNQAALRKLQPALN